MGTEGVLEGDPIPEKSLISALYGQNKKNPDTFTTMYIGSDNIRPCIQVG